MEGARAGLPQLGLVSEYSGSHKGRWESMEIDLCRKEGHKLKIRGRQQQDFFSIFMVAKGW